MRANAKKHARPNAALKIARRVIQLAKDYQMQDSED